jgi:hypothetical protein
MALVSFYACMLELDRYAWEVTGIKGTLLWADHLFRLFKLCSSFDTLELSEILWVNSTSNGCISSEAKVVSEGHEGAAALEGVDRPVAVRPCVFTVQCEWLTVKVYVLSSSELDRQNFQLFCFYKLDFSDCQHTSITLNYLVLVENPHGSL